MHPCIAACIGEENIKARDNIVIVTPNYDCIELYVSHVVLKISLLRALLMFLLPAGHLISHKPGKNRKHLKILVHLLETAETKLHCDYCAFHSVL